VSAQRDGCIVELSVSEGHQIVLDDLILVYADD